MTFQDILAARGDPDAVNEASLGRVFQHVKNINEKSFGILTSWRAGKSKRENLSDFKRLAGEVRGLGLGFFKLRGHWKECQDPSVDYADCPPGQLEDTKEPALFVPGITLQDVKRLGRKYEQDAVVYGGPDTKGKVMLIMRGGSMSSLGGFSPNKIAQAYSRVRGRAFTFEYVAQTWGESMIEQRLINELRTAVSGL